MRILRIIVALVKEHIPSLSVNRTFHHKVGGTITDENGEPLIGVTIMEEGTSNGTETGFMMKHGLTFETANENNSLLVSLNYLDNNGILKGKNDTHQRYNLNVNGEMKIKPWITVGLNGRLSYYKMNSVDDIGANKLLFNYDERWTPTNTHASRPRPKPSYEKEYYLSDAMVFNGSYFKIKQIQLGYTLRASSR